MSTDIVLSTPAEPVEVADVVKVEVEKAEKAPHSQRKKGKRKFSAKIYETRRKRRRSEDVNDGSDEGREVGDPEEISVQEGGEQDALSEQEVESQPDPEQKATRGTAKRRARVAARSSARRSARQKLVEEMQSNRTVGQQQHEQEEEEEEEKTPQIQDVVVEDDASSSRDTDEEIMSQLVSESNAASQAGSVPPEASLVVIQDSMVSSSFSFDRARQAKVDQERGEQLDTVAVAAPDTTSTESAESIMETLRVGMAGLQDASLSRDEFNKIEDMLVEMKRELFEAERRGRRGE
jgi:hypothetical protein